MHAAINLEENMLEEFKKFILRGNVVDLAVAVVIGGAFGKIIASLTNDVIMPPIGLLLGKVDFKELYINLSGTDYPSLKAATDAGAATINYGMFLNTIIEFLIIAFVLFLVIKAMNKLYPKPAEPAPAPTKECPYCKSSIPEGASRCPNCTSQL